jgi:hypothetical protein
MQMEKTQKYAARQVEIRVGFSHHCFTDTKVTTTATTEYAGRPKEPRYFCKERYQLSAGLPGIIQSLPGRNCFFAKQQNYFVVDSEQADTEYRVFFDVRNIGEANAVLLYVQSAYMASKKTAPNGKRKKVGFRVLVSCAVDDRRPIEPP